MSTISLKCKACGGSLDIDKDREVLFCPFCGSKEIFAESDEVKKTRIASKTYSEVEHARMQHEETMFREQVEATKSESDTKHRRRWTVVWFLVIILFVIPFIRNTTQTFNHFIKREIQPPSSYFSYIGEDYNTVASELKAAGFSNVVVIPETEESDSGEVIRVSIAGDPDFFSSEWFSRKSEVRIVYSVQESDN